MWVPELTRVVDIQVNQRVMLPVSRALFITIAPDISPKFGRPQQSRQAIILRLGGFVLRKSYAPSTRRKTTA